MSTDQAPQGQPQDSSVQTWGDMLKNVAAGSSQFIFPSRAERTPIRLIAPKYPYSPPDVVRVVQSEYQGNVRDKFLVLAYQSPQHTGEEDYSIKAVILPKTAWENILGMLTEGHSLFDLEEGHGVTLIRNKGQRTTYTAVNSPKPVPVPDEVRELIKAGLSIDSFVDAYAQMQANKGNNNGQQQLIPGAQPPPPPPPPPLPPSVQSPQPEW